MVSKNKHKLRSFTGAGVNRVRGAIRFKVGFKRGKLGTCGCVATGFTGGISFDRTVACGSRHEEIKDTERVMVQGH